MDKHLLIEAKNLSKTYVLDGKDFHALEDVSFNLRQNESLGLIGKNGSGKSTLLKILAGLIKPSSGSVTINGRVNSLIEIGSNFIPDLTGRENVKQFLSLNDIPKDRIAAIIEEIKEFSELGDFFDKPIKLYSSGMFVRLAISAGFQIDADIFLIDEVLMAGDAEFRQKVAAYFKALLVDGKCLILASHNPEEIRTNCNKALWLNEGVIKQLDDALDVLSLYNEQTVQNLSEKNYTKKAFKLPNTISDFKQIDLLETKNEALEITELSVNAISNEVSYDEGFQISLSYKINDPDKKLHPFFKIYDLELNPILVINPSNNKDTFDSLNTLTKECIEIKGIFPAQILSAGIYYLELMFGENPIIGVVHTKENFKLKKKLKFEVKSTKFDLTGDTHHVFIKPDCKWHIHEVF